MATCLDIIGRALRLIGVAAPGEPIQAADAETGLHVLNDLLQSVGLFRSMSASPYEEEFTLSPGVTDYEIGTGKTFNTPLPAQIDDSTFCRIGTLDYPLNQIDGEDWAAIRLKNFTGFVPDRFYFLRQADYGVIRFYPAPGSGVVLHLRSWKPFPGYSSITDEVILPAGFNRLLPYMLAEEIAPEYGRDVPASVIRLSAGARHQIKALQLEIPNMRIEPVKSGRFNVITGSRS